MGSAYDFFVAEIDLMDKEKEPSWLPKKLFHYQSIVLQVTLEVARRNVVQRGKDNQLHTRSGDPRCYIEESDVFIYFLNKVLESCTDHCSQVLLLWLE